MSDLDPSKVEGFTNPQTVARLMQLASQAQTIVEIGTWKGRTAIAMAVASPVSARIYCVDTWHGEVADETAGAAINPLGTYLGFLDNVATFPIPYGKIVSFPMTSVEASYWFRPDSVDLLYVDGNHEYDWVRKDLAWWYPKVRTGGILCGDDAFFEGVKRATREFFGSRLSIEIDGKFWMVLK